VSHKLLLIGGASSGKTHFGAQLLSRLQAGTGRLKTRDHPQTIALFENVLRRLGQGLSSDHTGAEVYGEIVLPAINSQGGEIDLVWPDYGGEQVEEIAERRFVTSEWVVRIEQSEAWVLMLRPMLVVAEDDLLNRPLHRMPTAGVSPKKAASGQTQIVELLQILRHSKRLNNLTPTDSPRMLVLLSCWDELGDGGMRPSELLAQRMPMVHAFLSSNWAPESLLIFGLSSLGKSLSPTQVDVEYQDRGPESFGYIVLPTGQRLRDLTLPIAEVAS